MPSVARDVAVLRARMAAAGAPLYLGAGTDGAVSPRPEHAVLVVGPPRSGKTTSIVIPNVLAAPGAVVTTSTKPDVLLATAGADAVRDGAGCGTRAARSTRPPG